MGPEVHCTLLLMAAVRVTVERALVRLAPRIGSRSPTLVRHCHASVRHQPLARDGPSSTWLGRRKAHRMMWEHLGNISSVLVDLVVLLGALAAALKFRLFNVLAHRWQSELECTHHLLPGGKVVFEADYTVRNFGQRPLAIRSVRIRLVAAKQVDGLLYPDDSVCYAERHIPGTEHDLAGNLDVQPGERSIFTLRCLLSDLEEIAFVVGTLDLPHRRTPAVFRSLYVRSASMTRDGAAPGDS